MEWIENAAAPAYIEVPVYRPIQKETGTEDTTKPPPHAGNNDRDRTIEVMRNLGMNDPEEASIKDPTHDQVPAWLHIQLAGYGASSHGNQASSDSPQRITLGSDSVSIGSALSTKLTPRILNTFMDVDVPRVAQADSGGQTEPKPVGVSKAYLRFMVRNENFLASKPLTWPTPAKQQVVTVRCESSSVCVLAWTIPSLKKEKGPDSLFSSTSFQLQREGQEEKIEFKLHIKAKEMESQKKGQSGFRAAEGEGVISLQCQGIEEADTRVPMTFWLGAGPGSSVGIDSESFKTLDIRGPVEEHDFQKKNDAALRAPYKVNWGFEKNLDLKACPTSTVYLLIQHPWSWPE